MLSLKIWTRIFTPQNLFYFIHCCGTYYISANKTIADPTVKNHYIVQFELYPLSKNSFVEFIAVELIISVLIKQLST
jgi:hypothetical protein